MSMLKFIQNLFFKKTLLEEQFVYNQNTKFKVCIVSFIEGIENSAEPKILNILKQQEALDVCVNEDIFNKDFLSLDSRSIFDYIDKGQDILYKTGADVLVWGYNDNGKLRLNFQTPQQYDKADNSFVSALDSLYFPYSLFEEGAQIPSALSNLLYGAVLSAINPKSAEHKSRRKYLLRKTIDVLTQDASAKKLSIIFMPYFMNFLGCTYLSYAYDKGQEKDFKIIKGLFEAALEHQDLINNPLHIGCIYYHLGQLHDNFAHHIDKNPLSYFKGAISNYQKAQKYLGKYTYAYDYGYISYKLSQLYFKYWKIKEDIQALRDSVFHLREAEKVYTYSLFPSFWAAIQQDLGQHLFLLSRNNNSLEISELAIAAFKNCQKVLTEKKDPITWAKTQEKIGEIYYRLGKVKEDRAMLEEALEYFHEALYIFENSQEIETCKKINISIAKTSESLAII